MAQNYKQVDRLKGLYLEDSYILAVQTEPGLTRMVMEFALTEAHPLYEPPLPGEQYCYRRGELIFAGPHPDWRGGRLPEYTDANGELDHGNIDSMVFEDAAIVIEGDFGSVTFQQADLSVVLF